MKLTKSYLLALVVAVMAAAVCVSCSKDDDRAEAMPAQKPSVASVIAAPEEMIIYEANPRLYGTSECLKGVEQRLDQIKALGTNVLWLMPICEFGKKNSIGSPYCIKDYTKVEPKYGTLDDLRSLVAAAHDRDMAVIIDWVGNHTSWDHVWMENKSWYTQDAAGNIIAPAGTGWNDVADLNFNNQAMRRKMIDAMKYWIKAADIDGYRCDAADWVPFDFWRKAIAELRASFPKKQLLMLAEGSSKNNFGAGFDMNYAWSYYDALESVFKGGSATKLHATHESEYKAVIEGGVKLRFTTNHDKTAYNGTPIEIYGGREGSLAALAITTFMGGAPMLYSSQECAQSSALSFMTYSRYNWAKDTDYTAELERIMALRRDNKLFAYGTTEDFSNSDVVMFARYYDGAEAFVVANVRNEERSVALPAAFKDLAMTDALANTPTILPEELTLAPYEYRIFMR